MTSRSTDAILPDDPENHNRKMQISILGSQPKEFYQMIRKITTQKPVLVKNFLDQKICQELAQWTHKLYLQNNLTLWSANNYLGGHRVFDPQNTVWEPNEKRILKPLIDIPNSFYESREKIKTLMKLETELIRKPATSLSGIMFRDGYVEPHKDSGVNGYVHLRANIFASSTKGGFPIIDNEIFDVKTGDLIIFAADLIEHSTTKQESNTPRVIVSYPFLMPQNFFT